MTHDDEEHIMLKTLCVHAKIKHSIGDHLITQNEEKEDMSRGRTIKGSAAAGPFIFNEISCVPAAVSI